MPKNVMAVLTDLNIGRNNDDPNHSDELLSCISTFIKNLDKNVEILLFNGNTFNSYKVTPKMAETFRNLCTMISNTRNFNDVVFNLGNYETQGRNPSEDNAISVVVGTEETSDLFSNAKIQIVTEPTIIYDFDITYAVCPHGTFSADMLPDEDHSEIKAYFTHQKKIDNSSEEPIFNGYIQQPSEIDNQINIGVPIQLDFSDVPEDLRFVVIDEDGNYESIPTETKIAYKTIHIENSLINSEMAVKWLAQNRALLCDALKITVIADEETDNNTLEKFTAVLSTVNNKFEIVDNIPKNTNIQLGQSTSSLDAMLAVLPKDKSIQSKAKQLFERASL